MCTRMQGTQASSKYIYTYIRRRWWWWWWRPIIINLTNLFLLKRARPARPFLVFSLMRPSRRKVHSFGVVAVVCLRVVAFSFYIWYLMFTLSGPDDWLIYFDENVLRSNTFKTFHTFFNDGLSGTRVLLLGKTPVYFVCVSKQRVLVCHRGAHRIAFSEMCMEICVHECVHIQHVCACARVSVTAR